MITNYSTPYTSQEPIRVFLTNTDPVIEEYLINHLPSLLIHRFETAHTLLKALKESNQRPDMIFFASPTLANQEK